MYLHLLVTSLYNSLHCQWQGPPFMHWIQMINVLFQTVSGTCIIKTFLALPPVITGVAKSTKTEILMILTLRLRKDHGLC